MKIIDGDIMNADVNLIVYLANGTVADKLKREHPSIYNWVFPRSPLPPGSIIKSGATPWQAHVIMFAAVDEYGGIKASDLHECFSEFKKYVKDYNIDEQDIGITRELYKVIKEKNYIEE